MPKALGLDYGEKRTGIAITDDLQMIASPLTTVETKMLIPYLEKLFSQEKIEVMVVGEAKYLNGQASATTAIQQVFATALQKKFPEKKIVRINEMFTSRMAAQALVTMGMKKKDRQNKGNLDKVSAALILQSYLDTKGFIPR